VHAPAYGIAPQQAISRNSSGKMTISDSLVVSTVKRKEFRYFSGKLEELRRTAKVTQGTLAEITGVSQPTVQAWLAGSTGPSIGHLIKLAAYFRLPTVDELIRPVPHASDSCVVPKRLLREVLDGAEDTARKIEQVLQDTGALERPGRKRGAEPGRKKRNGKQP